MPPAPCSLDRSDRRPLHNSKAGRQASTPLGAWLGLFSATEEALQHLINSTPYVHTSTHRVPKAEACPASQPLRLLPRADVTVATAPVCLPARQNDPVHSAITPPRLCCQVSLLTPSSILGHPSWPRPHQLSGAPLQKSRGTGRVCVLSCLQQSTFILTGPSF